MGLVILVLLLALLLAIAVFAIHLLWIFAVALLLFWLAGFAFRSSDGRGNWYYR
jgi:hypothetical protein